MLEKIKEECKAKENEEIRKSMECKTPISFRDLAKHDETNKWSGGTLLAFTNVTHQERIEPDSDDESEPPEEAPSLVPYDLFDDDSSDNESILLLREIPSYNYDDSSDDEGSLLFKLPDNSFSSSSDGEDNDILEKGKNNLKLRYHTYKWKHNNTKKDNIFYCSNSRILSIKCKGKLRVPKKYNNPS